MRRDFSEHHMMQVPITENQLGTMQMMEDVSEHVGMNNPEIPGSTIRQFSLSLGRGICGQPNYHGRG